MALLLIVFLRLVHLSLNYLRLAGEVFPDVSELFSSSLVRQQMRSLSPSTTHLEEYVDPTLVGEAVRRATEDKRIPGAEKERCSTESNRNSNHSDGSA